MEMVRWIIGGALGVGALICFSVAVEGVVSGTVGSPAKHASRSYSRAAQPDKFWTSVGYYFFVGVFAVYLAFEVFTIKFE